ncbi:deaminase domain-containing protein [Calycomorphotria hydatis]|uniref:Uncharacterized protein n=1 Tax=Calycomorphotria hydatis TaxID=2528027 RepID=A0A517TA46_9PLAN|nr:deaminase domain-containing protein [Calycomorphotria hydatis]QDT65250.1 hypothetical protein V22_24970 [Calycomorphotria hydatis]
MVLLFQSHTFQGAGRRGTDLTKRAIVQVITKPDGSQLYYIYERKAGRGGHSRSTAYYELKGIRPALGGDITPEEAAYLTLWDGATADDVADDFRTLVMLEFAANLVPGFGTADELRQFLENDPDSSVWDLIFAAAGDLSFGLGAATKTTYKGASLASKTITKLNTLRLGLEGGAGVAQVFTAAYLSLTSDSLGEVASNSARGIANLMGVRFTVKEIKALRQLKGLDRTTDKVDDIVRTAGRSTIPLSGSVRRLQEDAAQTRSYLASKEGRNWKKFRTREAGTKKAPVVAVSELELDNQTFTVRAFSGETQLDNFAPYVPDPNRRLKANIDYPEKSQFLRDVDAEAKIFERMLDLTNPNTSGTLRMYVDKILCLSCKDMAKRFKKLRPNIKLELSWPDGAETF